MKCARWIGLAIPLGLGMACQSGPSAAAPGSRRTKPAKTVFAVTGTSHRRVPLDLRWQLVAPEDPKPAKPPGQLLGQVAFPPHLDLPANGRQVLWPAVKDYVRVLPLRGAPRPISVVVRDLGSGLSIETMALYRGDGDQGLIGRLSANSSGVRWATGLTWDGSTMTIRIAYDDEPPLVVPADEVWDALQKDPKEG